MAETAFAAVVSPSCRSRATSASRAFTKSCGGTSASSSRGSSARAMVQSPDLLVVAQSIGQRQYLRVLDASEAGVHSYEASGEGHGRCTCYSTRAVVAQPHG